MLLAQFIVIQTILFAGVIFFLRKIMMGSTESAVSHLNDVYVQMNQKKEELSRKIQQAQEDYEARKKEAEKIAEKIKNDADEEMRNQKDEMLKKAREEAERIIVDTVGAKENIREELHKEEKLKMIDHCKNLLEGLYSDITSREIDSILISSFLSEVQDADSGTIPDSVRSVEIISRRELPEDIRDKVRSVIKGKCKSEVKISEVVNDDILGGVVIKFGNLVLDGSIAGKLNERSTKIKEKIERGH